MCILVLSAHLLTTVITVSFLCYRWVNQLDDITMSPKEVLGNKVKSQVGVVSYGCVFDGFYHMISKDIYVTLRIGEWAEIG